MRAAHIRCSCAAAVVSGTYLTENSFVSVKRTPSADRTMRTKFWSRTGPTGKSRIPPGLSYSLSAGGTVTGAAPT